MKGMNTELSAFLEEKNFLPVGEQNPKIKQIKGILSNSKPNPQKLFVAEGIWILKMCEKFAAPVESLVLCPAHIRTAEAAELGKTARRARGRTVHRFGKDV